MLLQESSPSGTSGMCAAFANQSAAAASIGWGNPSVGDHGRGHWVYGRPTEAIGTLTFHPGYATSRISSILNGRTKQFGWLQAPATTNFFSFSNFREPCNHPN
jgi:hypothetical protein